MRAGVTFLLLGIVASQLDWGLMERRVADGRPVDFLLAVGLVLLALCLGAWRWHALLERADVHLSASRLARIYAVSTFSNTFLPTTMGGDVARTLLVTRSATLLPRVATTVVIDRLGGFAGLMAIAWGAYAAQPGSVPSGALAFLAVSTAAVVGGTILLFLSAVHGPPALRRAIPERLGATARAARELLRDYAGDPGLLVRWLMLSVAFQALVALQLVLLASSIGVTLSFPTAAVALALVTIVTLIPISIGGFGVREGSYVVLLGGASIAASDATLISILSVAAVFVASLPGAYLLVRGRVGAQPEVAAP